MSAAVDSAGGWDARAYGQHARFVQELAAPLVDWLAPVPGEHILDLGCGDGSLTLAIAERGATVLGLDASAEFVAAAQARGLAAEQGDGQTLAYRQRFDAVFSNAALHWMKRDPKAVITGVYAALKPGGRFVAELGAAGNCAPIRAALRDEIAARGQSPDSVDPWHFPHPEDYIKQLIAAGFEIQHEESFARPTELPGDMTDWLRTLARPFVYALPATAREDYVAAVSARLQPQLQAADGRWIAPYVRLRFCARRPAEQAPPTR